MNKLYYLACNRIPSIGPRTLFKLLQQWPSLEVLFKLSPNAMEKAGLPPRLASAIAQYDLRSVEQDLLWEQQNPQHHHLITWEDAAYPKLLKEIHAPPLVLYAQGNLACLQQSALAIVGTRKPSITGGKTAWQFAYELSQQGLCIVSGLALGIDAQAHQGCLAAQGKTIAVMGTGINRIYPAQHRALAEKIKERGLLMSEFPLNSAATPGHFPQRNRIISGLSLAILVVEAAIKSGSLITARFALEQNRDVLAIPGSIHSPQARGCHHLLQQGAKLVTTSQEVLEELDIPSRDPLKTLPFITLANDALNLVKCVGFEVTSIEEIMHRSQLNFSELTGILSEIELQGLVKNVPGGYVRCGPIE